MHATNAHSQSLLTRNQPIVSSVLELTTTINTMKQRWWPKRWPKSCRMKRKKPSNWSETRSTSALKSCKPWSTNKRHFSWSNNKTVKGEKMSAMTKVFLKVRRKAIEKSQVILMTKKLQRVMKNWKKLKIAKRRNLKSFIKCVTTLLLCTNSLTAHSYAWSTYSSNLIQKRNLMLAVNRKMKKSQT